LGKLFTNEVGGMKMKKNDFKNALCNLKKHIFFSALSLAASLALHFKDDS